MKILNKTAFSKKSVRKKKRLSEKETDNQEIREHFVNAIHSRFSRVACDMVWVCCQRGHQVAPKSTSPFQPARQKQKNNDIP